MKKAQTKMFETITVIIVFFILMAFGFVIYANMQKGALSIQMEEAKNAKALRIAKTVLSMPELQCNSKTYCFDSLKIMAFNSNSATKSYYFDLLKYSSITIKRIYPLSDNPDENNMEIYDKTNPSMSSKQSIWIPVALNEPLHGKTSFAMLKVDIYE